MRFNTTTQQSKKHIKNKTKQINKNHASPVVDLLFVVVVQMFAGDVVNHSSGNLLSIHGHATPRFLWREEKSWYVCA